MTDHELSIFRDLIREELKTRCSSCDMVISKEQHSKDHYWLNEFIAWHKSIQSTIWKTIVGTIITAIGALVLIGFLFFRRGQ